ncbi:MAG: spore coat U domain-containing protein [Phenylobacterium sp.]|nr:spore coat U domain-containing protein [Phenylobacterium sp.]
MTKYFTVAGITLAMIPAGASAATANGSFQVNMTVQGACSVVSATSLDFGSHSTIASNVDSSSTIGVQCTNATPYSIGLSAGQGAGATVSSRLLTSGGQTIPYGIYRDAGHTQLWGATPAVDTQGGTGSGAVQSFTIYGRVAPVANPQAGAYTDTVSVTVTY